MAIKKEDLIDAKKNIPEDPFFKQIKEKLESDDYKIDEIYGSGQYALNGEWDKYASNWYTSKVRDSGKFNPLFIYRPAYHLFEDTLLWDGILPNENRLWQ